MWLGAWLVEATASDSFLDVSAGRIIGGEIVFERFRFVADGEAFAGHSEIPRLSGFQRDKG
jgi:hypothetical protein